MSEELSSANRFNRPRRPDNADSGPLSPGKARPLASFRAHQGSLIAACTAILVAVATPSLVGNIVGSITVRLQVTGSQLTWAASVVWLGAAAAAYLAGSLADRLGRKRVLATSTVIIAIGAVVSAYSGSVDVFLIGQVLAGVGAGGLGAVSLTMVAAASRSSKRRPLYLAAFAGCLTAGPIVSATLDASLATRSSYERAFLALAAVSVLALVIIVVCGGESYAEQPRAIDVPGQVALIIGLASLLWGVIEGTATSWGSASVIIAFVLSAVAFFGFVLIERRPNAMLDLSVFRIRAFSLAAAVAIISWFVFIGSAYIYSIRITVAQGHTPLFSALGLILLGVVAGTAGFACRPALTRFAGVRALVIGGLLCFAIADLWLALAPVGDRSFTAMLGFLILYGIGQAATTAGVSAAAVNSVPAELESTAASTQEMLRVMGPPMGIAVMGALIFSHSQSAFSARLARLPLSPQLGHVIAAVNARGSVLGILESGLGGKVPPVGSAAVAALGSAMSLSAYTGAIICAVAALLVALFLRAPGVRDPSGEQPGGLTASTAELASPQG